MNPMMQWMFLTVVFLSVLALGLLTTYLLAPGVSRDRLLVAPHNLPEPGKKRRWSGWYVKFARPLARLSIPEQGWENSPLKIRFMNAGFRRESAPLIYFGLKTLLALVLAVLPFLFFGLAGGQLSAPVILMSTAVAGAFGYYLPNVVLSHLRETRQRAIEDAFPDTLDLLTVCVEAGLGLDAALARVTVEVERTSPVISEELNLVALELRAGASKEKALRNLALRVSIEDVDGLAALLIQAERFGTSISESLRVQGAAMRVRRRQRAEEIAGKLPVKLLLPLTFCIFPSILLVTMGPALLQVYRHFLPALTTAH